MRLLGSTVFALRLTSALISAHIRGATGTGILHRVDCCPQCGLPPDSYRTCDDCIDDGHMALTLGIGAINTFQEYFVRRGPEPRLYYQLNQDVADLTRYLDSLPDEGQPMYVGALDYRHPTAGGSPGSFRWNRVWYNNLGRTDVAV